METLIFILLLVAIALLGVVVFKTFQKKGFQSDSAVLLQKQLEELRKTLDSKLGESTKLTHEITQKQLHESGKMIREVTKELTELRQTNKQVVSFADQLQSLQDTLQNPKRRGVLGEYYLETVLKNVLPPSVYKMQHTIGKSDDGNDLIVDAALFIEDKIIPIDSKFSLENYNRLAEEKNVHEQERLEKSFKKDLKARIDETSKYIRPEDGTMDFALMFIPSEAIFYDLLINQVGAVKVSTEDLVQYAARKRVNIVSPNSFYAFLQVILQGLKQMQIEKSAETIIKKVDNLGKHMRNYDQFIDSLGKSLGTTVNHYNKAYKEFGKIDRDVVKITGATASIEPAVLDRPKMGDDL